MNLPSPAHRIPLSFRQRRGFTLIELLVVMVIIGILIAILLPAVNAARESARATQSRNNLKQIGLAIGNFNTSRGYYPPSWLAGEPPAQGAGYPNFDGWSLHILILPYLEQKLIHDEIDFTKNYNYYVQPNPTAGTTPPIFTLADGSSVVLSTLRVPTYISPAEPRDEIRENKHYPTNYAVNLGTWFVYDPQTRKGGNGAAFPNSKLRDGAFADGLSSTVCMAEVRAWQPYFRDSNRSALDFGATAADLPETAPVPLTPADLGALMGSPGEYKETGHTEWFNGHVHHAGFTTVFRPDQKVMCGNRISAISATVSSTATGNTNVDWTNWQEGKNVNIASPSTTPTYAAITARGYFANVVNVSMMDGSVRSIDDKIDLGVWRAISTRAGREKLPNSFNQ
jgi:prepilin-type N-terminal cleavage/methylation domain-containing protein